METKSLPVVALFCREGGSDKEYHLSIEPKDGLFVVNFANGRRGGNLQHGTKTNVPVTLPAAEKIYNKVLKEKLGKGYTEGEGKAAFAGTDMAERATDFRPQLLTFIPREEIEALIEDDGYIFQEKMDGNRVTIRKTGDKVEAINRKGLLIPFPKDVEAEMTLVSGDVTLDGEMIGQVFHAFDCLLSKGDLTESGFEARYRRLVDVLGTIKRGLATAVVLVPAAIGSEAKAILFADVEKRNGEGVVAKRTNASYSAGKDKGGNALKFKFRESATVIVAKVNDQRSVAMAVLDAKGAEVGVGNVTIPANAEIPKEGDLIEVTYLYAYRGGSLFQPTFSMVRTDIDREDAAIAQLKYKPEPK